MLIWVNSIKKFLSSMKENEKRPKYEQPKISQSSLKIIGKLSKEMGLDKTFILDIAIVELVNKMFEKEGDRIKMFTWFSRN